MPTLSSMIPILVSTNQLYLFYTNYFSDILVGFSNNFMELHPNI